MPKSLPPRVGAGLPQKLNAALGRDTDKAELLAQHIQRGRTDGVAGSG